MQYKWALIARKLFVYYKHFSFERPNAYFQERTGLLRFNQTFTGDETK
jgi:hypothetical protein